MANEVRLIDANAFCERYSHFGLVNGSTIGRHSGMAEFLLDELQKAPTIDPESLRPKGRWGVHRESEISKTVYCTNCWKDFYIHRKGELQIDTQPYCPNCGAKMEG